MTENEYYSDSFRALSPEKLGVSVLMLCAEKDELGIEESEMASWNGVKEEE